MLRQAVSAGTGRRIRPGGVPDCGLPFALTPDPDPCPVCGRVASRHGADQQRAEGAPLRAIMHGGMRHGLRTAGGMRASGVTMTCLCTWRTRGPDAAERLREALAAA